jgi:hypothetical protein
VVEAEALLQRVDLGRQRGGIAGVAGEDLDGDRATVGSAEQAVGDLQLARLAVPACQGCSTLSIAFDERP